MNTTAHMPTWRVETTKEQACVMAGKFCIAITGNSNTSSDNRTGPSAEMARQIVDEHNAHDSLKAQNAELVKALRVVANCTADDQGGTTLGSYEMGVVLAALAGVTP